MSIKTLVARIPSEFVSIEAQLIRDGYSILEHKGRRTKYIKTIGNMVFRTDIFMAYGLEED